MIARSLVASGQSILHAPVMELRSKGRTLTLLHRTGIVGVMNTTPDSYIPGSRAETSDAILTLAEKYIHDGADILEIGGESTGSASSDVSVGDELARVVPAVTLLRKKFPDVWISVDTYKADVAREALAAGADMINDITAGRGDERMFGVIADAGCPVVLMYAKDDSPRTTIQDIRYDDVIKTIKEFLAVRMAAARKFGIDQILLDPGLGHFISSDPAYSWEILMRLSELTSLGPVLVSPSRKSFLAGTSALPASERLPATIAANCIASLNGAALIRTHNVHETRQALDAIARIVR